jgi:iron complex outermembrane recepter protein
MKKLFFLILALFPLLMFGQQQFKVSGKVFDAGNAGETLIGVNIVYAKGMGVVTDINGNYTLNLTPGKYMLQFSYVGYEKTTNEITVTDKDQVLNVGLNSIVIDEVVVIADIARTRETPIAFSTIRPSVIQESLGNQDIPMLLNRTPGVYATQQGGGDGDASVTIRGFSSRNIGILLDGVPVNDMETGQVYWSNWFGLEGVTRYIQVQRGLGKSKLALPSVGGTINIITKGMDTKKEGMVRQEVGSDGYLNTSFGYSSGALKNGWGISVAGSYKTGNGWVDETWTKGFFYYLKIDKKIGNHMISASGYGAPQSHAQRAYQLPIGVYDSAYAEKVGIKLSYLEAANKADSILVSQNRGKLDEGIGRGLRFNQHWGYLARTDGNPDAKSEPYAERVNEYHKPQFTLKDFWTISDRLYISNIAYMSIGHGGGIRLKNTPTPNADGLIPFQQYYDRNSKALPSTLFDDTLRPASNYMRELINQHIWYGLISTVNFKLNSNFQFAAGIDLRSYKATHYEKVYDLLGADYVGSASDFIDYSKVDWTQANPLKNYMLKVGDRTNYYTEGMVRWGGLFFQTEYSMNKISSFINLTTALSSYNQIDHFYGLKSSIVTGETGWKNFPGFTAKGGVNYNFTEHINGFFNLGYLSRATRFNNVFDFDNSMYKEIKNELTKAAEIGGSYSSKSFTANLNAYYTIWENKPMDSNTKLSVETSPGEFQEFSVNINGMDALHKGIEFDFIFKATDKLDIQGLMSLGDWRWNSSDTVRIYDDNRNLIGKRFFDATGVHVGNSAQTQFGGEIRYEPIKSLYFKATLTYFGKYYSEFDPISLDGTPASYEWYEEATGKHGNAKDSWEVPSYTLLDLGAGYRFKIKHDALQFRLNMTNALNTTYIATAQNNDTFNGITYNEFNARSASAFFGMGRRFVVSMQYQF